MIHERFIRCVPTEEIDPIDAITSDRVVESHLQPSPVVRLPSATEGSRTGSEPSPAKPKLLDQVRDAIRTRHYSYRTEACLPKPEA